MLRRLLFLIALLFAAPASAQLAPRTNAIAPELVVEGPATPGGEVELAILMRTTPGWHGYWLNPGDAGLPMRIEWELPKGATLTPLRYPVPGKLLVSDIVNYVYERDYALLTRVKIPADARGTVPIRATAQWLACTNEVCVPERGSFSAVIMVGNGPPTERARFDEWRRALPRPLATSAKFALHGDRIEIAVPLPASVTVGEPYFFPADDGPIDYAAPQTVRRSGDTLIIELKRRRGEPAQLAGVLALGDGLGLEFTAVPGAVPSDGQPLGGLGAMALLLAILGALVGGMLLNLMPCVFPILALKALHLAKSSGNERAARRDALGYTAGAILGTGALGVTLLALRASGVAAGWAFQLQDPRSILVLLILAVAITLNLLRAFELPTIGGEASPAGSIGTGALAAFVATPCTGPFLGAALGATLLLPAWAGLAIFAALGLGLALPFLILAFVPALRTRLPRPGQWMVRLQRILAIPMALSAVACLWLLWRQGGRDGLIEGIGYAGLATVAFVTFGSLQRGGGLKPLIGSLVGAFAVTIAAVIVIPERQVASAVSPLGQPWSEQAVRGSLAQGHPAFVYFTADWCLTCKANEAAAIERDATRDAFAKAGVKILVGDWTNGDPAITRLLESRGRAGVPLYLWYEPGRPEPEELPQILTPSMLSERAGRTR